MARNVSVEHIVSWRNRRDGMFVGTGAYLLQGLEGKLTNRDSDIAFLEYCILKSCAIFESEVRLTIARIIDSTPSALEGASALLKGVKVDLNTAQHLSGKIITVGEFVAHTVSINDLASALSILQAVVPQFERLIRSVHARWQEEEDLWPLPAIIPDWNDVMRSFAWLYQTRHVLAHEAATKIEVRREDVKLALSSAKNFLEALEWTLVELHDGSVPRTQLRMNDNSRLRAEGAKGGMSEAIASLEEMQWVDRTILHQSQRAWEEMMELTAMMVARQVEGGSMYPALLNNERETLTTERTAQLKRILGEGFD